MLHPGTYYHIFNHANGDDNLFLEGKNYPFFLEKYHHHSDPIADTIAWCLMPSHFHLLVRIKDAEELLLLKNLRKFRTLEGLVNNELKLSHLLSKQFSNFFSGYSQAFNKVYQRRGSLFIKNFKRKEVNARAYLCQLILYIHLNPVKHGFTREVGNWPRSSYFDFWQQQNSLAQQLFETKEAYIRLHTERRTQFTEYNYLETDILTSSL